MLTGIFIGLGIAAVIVLLAILYIIASWGGIH